MTNRKEAADLFNSMSLEQQAVANSAFTSVSEALKAFGIPVVYDDRAERLVHQIAVYMKECASPDESSATSYPT